MYRAITYIGKGSGKVVRFKNKVYEFEWQKSLGIGNRSDEVEFDHAMKIAKRKTKKGKKLFILE
jgi:hypothetical protein